jgi:hypothetical protein
MTTGESAERIPPSLRTEALEQLLTERGLVDPNVLASLQAGANDVGFDDIVRGVWPRRAGSKDDI